MCTLLFKRKGEFVSPDGHKKNKAFFDIVSPAFLFSYAQILHLLIKLVDIDIDKVYIAGSFSFEFMCFLVFTNFKIIEQSVKNPVYALLFSVVHFADVMLSFYCFVLIAWRL